ncbi:thioesterase family protein [Primorskyibacter sp. S87]|uniref:thioesterase family protein n=1 Tax=Primorskyibacter sp. S87 TaxID=3415126 RepID=UPI003C79D6E7
MAGLLLSEVLNAAEPLDGGLSFPVPANWTQGRTAYGGFTSALLLAAARRGHEDLPPLRSALINFTAPVAEPPTIRAETLRQGRNVTTVNARAEIGGKVAAAAMFSFGRAQKSQVAFGLKAPKADAPEDAAAYLSPGAQRRAATFFENFEMRMIEGDLPFSGSDRGYLRVWARHRDPEMHGSIEGLIAIADLLPPAVFPMLSQPGPNSSVNWICNLLADAPRTRDGWWMVESKLTAGSDGYSSQVMRMWNTDGDLVVDGMQSVVIFV